MIRTVGLAPPLMLSGGVVQNQAIPSLLEDETNQKVVIPRYPQLMGAYGAALIALDIDASSNEF
jgi:activator of 2-hydroxyglutaryl-CoA dehydratase